MLTKLEPGQLTKLTPGKVYVVTLSWDNVPGKPSSDLDLGILRRGTGSPLMVCFGSEGLARPDLGGTPKRPWFQTKEGELLHKGDFRSGGNAETAVLTTAVVPPSVESYSFVATNWREGNFRTPPATFGDNAKNVKFVVHEEGDPSTGFEISLDTDPAYKDCVTAEAARISFVDGVPSLVPVIGEGNTDYLDEYIERIGATLG